MAFNIATETLEAIEAAMVADQGASFRGFLGQVIMSMSDAYDTTNKPFRSHLGGSMIGRKCSRELWYGFRWATNSQHNGKLLRLFNRGHLEEARFIALLRIIGCEVWTENNGKQFRISGVNGHFGGSLDSVLRGMPDLPGEAMLGEYKTHGDKSFTKLIKEGMQKSKPEHYIQQQIYMGKMDLTHSLYMAVNKNTDALHAELVEFDPNVYQRYLDRAEMIVWTKKAPAKISTNPGWYECNFCDHRSVCHGKDLPAINCRTCKHSEPNVEGTWTCVQDGNQLTPDQQRAGCDGYEVNPEIKKPI